MIEVQQLRGNASTTPSAGTVVLAKAILCVDADVWGIRVHDGTTPGGHLLSPSAAGPIPPSTMLSNTTNTTTSASGNTLTQFLDFTAGSTVGAVLTRSSTSWTAALPASSGASINVLVVSSGTSFTVPTPLTNTRTQIVWRSGTSGAKTTAVPPASTWGGYEIGIKTTLNNGDTHNIVASGGTIDGNATVSFVDTKANIPLIADGLNNDWLVS